MITDIADRLRAAGSTNPSGTHPYESLIDDAEDAIRTLRSEVSTANARERVAFMAGAYAVIGDKVNDIDIEQMWQQYRCQNETDWKAVSEDKNHDYIP